MGDDSSVPSVLAFVLNWNACAMTLRCVEAATASRGVDLEVVAIDNASPDGSGARLVERLGKRGVLQLPENRGYAGGMNAALDWWLRQSKAAYLLLLTQDVVVEPDTVASLVAAMASRPRVGIVGPVVQYQESMGISAGGLLDPASLVVRHRTEIASPEPYDTDWVDGACMLISRPLVEETGGFDERYFLYYEENDFCQRARQRGWRVLIAPDARIRHETATLPGPHYFYYMGRNSFLFWRKNFGVGRRRVAAAQFVGLARAGLGLAKRVVVPGRWPDAPDAFRSFARQLRGTVLGTYDYLGGRLGRQRF